MRQRCLVTFVKLKIILSKTAKFSRTIHVSDVVGKVTAGKHARFQNQNSLLGNLDHPGQCFVIGVRKMDILNEIAKSLLSTRRTYIALSVVLKGNIAQGTAIAPTICRIGRIDSIDRTDKFIRNCIQN